MTTPAPSAPTIPVFDIGGVLLDWNPRHLYAKLIEDEAEREWFLTEVCSPAWNETMDAGRTFAEGVAELAARHPDLRHLIEAFDMRWTEMVPRAIEGTVALLEQMKGRGTPVYAITNFSAEKFPVARDRWPFLHSFDGVVVSGEERLMKPDPAIYLALTERYGLDPGACLFIDDRASNVEGARAVGMAGHHFRDPETLESVLLDLGLIERDAAGA